MSPGTLLEIIMDMLEANLITVDQAKEILASRSDEWESRVLALRTEASWYEDDV